MTRLRSAWLSLAIVVGLHVVDEAAHDFLSVYNPVAAGLRARFDSSFPPAFSFGVWLGGLIALVVLCIVVTPLLDARRKWIVVIAIVWSVIHIANGLAHLVSSVAIGRMMPGVWTSPLLLLVAPWLLVESWLALFGNRRAPVTIATVILLLVSHPAPARAQQPLPYAPVGLFFGSIEEGARIFTPTRFLPFGHPEAGTHQFPTVLQLHGSEFQMLVWLGEKAGYHLWPTLERYPKEPSSNWPYSGFRPPPDTAALHTVRFIRHDKSEAPLPGLRAVLFDGATLVAFIVDTRALTLAERHMSRATSMGLDLPRAEFLSRLQHAAPSADTRIFSVVLYGPG